MKFIKFIEIKNFFTKLLDKEYSDMNYLIQYDSILAISEKIKEGYSFDTEQEYFLTENLKRQYKYFAEIEKLFKSNIPEKYVYGVIFENCSETLFADPFKNKYLGELTKDWLIKQNQKSLSIKFSEHWVTSFSLLLKNNPDDSSMVKKIEQFNTYKDYVSFIPENNKKQLLKFINSASNHLSISNKDTIKKSLNKIQILIETSNNTNNEVSKDFNNDNQKYLIQLKEENEINVLNIVIEINTNFQSIIKDMDNIDTLKKESLLILYDNHVNKILKHYLSIKKELRTKILKENNSEDLILGVLKDINNIFVSELKDINEFKLMSLSSKKEYFSQLKKQW